MERNEIRIERADGSAVILTPVAGKPFVFSCKHADGSDYDINSRMIENMNVKFPIL
jgi:hypothetical protein